MNPFAELIRSFRVKRGLRQFEVAALLGCGRRTITAAESGAGHGVKNDLAERLCKALALSEEEQLELEKAVRRSQRVYSIPEEAPAAAYELVYELFDRLDRLTALEIDLIRTTLRLHSERLLVASPATGHVARRDKVWRSNSVP